jgi:hypothetical protein
MWDGSDKENNLRNIWKKILCNFWSVIDWNHSYPEISLTRLRDWHQLVSKAETYVRHAIQVFILGVSDRT